MDGPLVALSLGEERLGGGEGETEGEARQEKIRAENMASGDSGETSRASYELEERLAKADAIASTIHPFALKQAAYLETVADGKALVAAPGPLSGSALPLRIPKVDIGDADARTAAAAAGLPEAEKFPVIPQLDTQSAEHRALAQVLRHMVPVGADWAYYLLVERTAEWEPVLRTRPPRRLLTKRYLADKHYFLKGCHLLKGAGSLDKVLQRLASADDSEEDLDAKLKGWLVLQADLSIIKEAFRIPVMAEVLHVRTPDGTAHPDWDDTIHPHIFGPLPLAAVTRTAPVVRSTSGDGGRVTFGLFTDFVEEEEARRVAM